MWTCRLRRPAAVLHIVPLLADAARCRRHKREHRCLPASRSRPGGLRAQPRSQIGRLCGALPAVRRRSPEHSSPCRSSPAHRLDRMNAPIRDASLINYSESKGSIDAGRKRRTRPHQGERVIELTIGRISVVRPPRHPAARLPRVKAICSCRRCLASRQMGSDPIFARDVANFPVTARMDPTGRGGAACDPDPCPRRISRAASAPPSLE